MDTQAVNYPKRIMVVGNGGRECAIATALLESERVERLVISPANWGIVDQLGGRVLALDIAVDDHTALIAAAKEQQIELVVIGPEAPLVAGLADDIRSAGIPVLGPSREAAQLEGSKSFAKEFMRRHAIPTAKYQSFSDYEALTGWIERNAGPQVLKADGLAAGKGVVICDDSAEAPAAAARIMQDKEFGSAGSTVLVEERLSGPEISFTCLIAGGHAEVLPPSSDYKRLSDNDEGPNTGGMGNICPAPWATDEVLEDFCANILGPVMRGLRADNIDYRGFLFIGTMLTEQGLKVIEFNVRFGDPEAEVVLPLCIADWPQLLASMADGLLPANALRLREGACVAIVLASANYPYGQSDPVPIEGLSRAHSRGLLTAQADSDGNMQPPPLRIYFAGVSRGGSAGAGGGGNETYTNYFEEVSDARYLASGGRVLVISAHAADLSLARRLAYEAAGNIHFAGMKLRGDIAKLR